VLFRSDDIIGQTRRINTIVQSLVAFAHSDTPPRNRFEPVDLAALVDEAIRLTRLAGRKDIRYELDGLAEQTVLGARPKLLQVFINLLTNAEQASPAGATIRVRARRTGAAVRITIHDEGPGIAASTLDRLFEPFFTTKPAGRGTGLGLPVAYSIVQDHGGSLVAMNAPEGGAQFILTLPPGRPA